MDYSDTPRDPSLLRVPSRCHSAEEVLGIAQKLNLGNILVISESAEGQLIMVHAGVNAAELNYLLDKAKRAIWDEMMGWTDQGL